MTDRYDWDALAPYWHLFEDRGSDASVVAAVVSDGARAPALYVGAGLGTYAATLARSLGPVIALDRSPTMARLAHARHPALSLVVGDVLALPFEDATFQTAVCATGVFELLGDRRDAAYRELGRVAGPGTVYVAAFVRSGVSIDRHAAIAAWLSGEAEDPLLDRLASELGERERAARLVEGAMPRYDHAVGEREIIDAASAAGRSSRRLLADRGRGIMLWRHD